MKHSLVSAEWRHLAFVNFAVEPELLRPFLPPGVDVDLENGSAYVSLVGLLFQKTKLFGARPRRWQSFAQVNLRFYVRRKVQKHMRRGVVFVREVVPEKRMTQLARLFGEKYETYPTSHEISFEPGGRDGMGRPISDGNVVYTWGLPQAPLKLSLRTVGLPQPVGFSPLEQFLAQRPYSYTSRLGRTIEFKVNHPEWFYWDVEKFSLEGDFVNFYGEPWGTILRGQPEMAFLAKGSPVTFSVPRVL